MMNQIQNTIEIFITKINPLRCRQITIPFIFNRELRQTRKKVEGEAWEALFKQAEGAGSRQGQGSKYIYLPAKTPPLAEWTDHEYPYFTLELPGKSPVFLWAGLTSTHSAMTNDDITWRMSHPYAGLSPHSGLGPLFEN